MLSIFTEFFQKFKSFDIGLNTMDSFSFYIDCWHCSPSCLIASKMTIPRNLLRDGYRVPEIGLFQGTYKPSETWSDFITKAQGTHKLLSVKTKVLLQSFVMISPPLS